MTVKTVTLFEVETEDLDRNISTFLKTYLRETDEYTTTKDISDNYLESINKLIYLANYNLIAKNYFITTYFPEAINEYMDELKYDLYDMIDKDNTDSVYFSMKKADLEDSKDSFDVLLDYLNTLL